MKKGVVIFAIWHKTCSNKPLISKQDRREKFCKLLEFFTSIKGNYNWNVFLRHLLGRLDKRGLKFKDKVLNYVSSSYLSYKDFKIVTYILTCKLLYIRILYAIAHIITVKIFKNNYMQANKTPKCQKITGLCTSFILYSLYHD